MHVFSTPWRIANNKEVEYVRDSLYSKFLYVGTNGLRVQDREMWTWRKYSGKMPLWQLLYMVYA